MRRPWVIKPWLVAAMLGAFVVHGVLAEWLGFGFLSIGERREWLPRRMLEFLFLWPFACMAVGWVQYVRKVPIAQRAAIWPLIAVVGLAGLAFATDGLSDVLQAYRSWSSGRLPRIALDTAVQIWSTSLLAAAIFSAAPATWIYTQALAWRQRITPGLCPVCDYDLTGNASGACPECGERVVDDPKVPRWFFGQRFWWLPELAQYPDALARKAAWEHVLKVCRAPRWQWIWLAVIGATIAAQWLLPERHTGYRNATIYACLLVSACYALRLRALARRELRRLLAQPKT